MVDLMSKVNTHQEAAASTDKADKESKAHGDDVQTVDDAYIKAVKATLATRKLDFDEDTIKAVLDAAADTAQTVKKDVDEKANEPAKK